MIELFDRLWSASVAFHNAGGVINMFFSISLQIAASCYLVALFYMPIIMVLFFFKRLVEKRAIEERRETDEHFT